jgi:GT2 family glycosyltransferase
MSDASTTLSVVLAVYNEAPVLRDTLASLLSQRLPAGHALEVLVIDGGSPDGSADIAREIAATDGRVRVLHNPRRLTPYAFNIGIQDARGDYVCILGAHCRYAPDYLAVCLQELHATGAVGCSGRLLTQPASATLGAELSSWTLGHPFGVSGASARTQPEGFVDSPAFPVFRRQALLDVGGYDEAMVRNQDNDMNYRLRQAGHRLYCTWKTSCAYGARPDLPGLWNYARANGFWCGISSCRQPASLGLRHYTPLVFWLVTTAGILLLPVAWSTGGWRWGLIAASPILVHLVLGHLAGLHLAVRQRRLAGLLMPWVFLRFHLTYGYAFARGLIQERLGRFGRIATSPVPPIR